ncbi:MAG: response regulator [Burkholderiales bacterium]|nr:MAG: response regulator [Burkholderiales bacterium]
MSAMTTEPCVALVDDDESLCRSMARMLRASGIRSVSYQSAECLLADSQHCSFDCLILDIQLGGMSGVELAERLAARGSTTPVIFITAHDEPDLRERALRAGCVAYLRKSDPGEVVLDALHRAFPQPA